MTGIKRRAQAALWAVRRTVGSALIYAGWKLIGVRVTLGIMTLPNGKQIRL